MSVPPVNRVLPNVPGLTRDGLRELEIWLKGENNQIRFGPWIYVGTQGVDRGANNYSPPFQNSWANALGGRRRLRFRLISPKHEKRVNSVELEGEIFGGEPGTVVFTLPEKYRPSEMTHAVGTVNESSLAIWRIEASGDVSFVTTAAGGASGPAGGVLNGTYPDPGLNVDDSTVEVNADTVRVKASGITSNELDSSGVVAGTYGDDTHVAQFTVDEDGRITDATDVAITGGGGGGTFTIETPSGTINGSNVTFTITTAPDPTADLLLFKNGLLMEQGASADYTLSGTTITMATAPATGSKLLAAIPAIGGGGGSTIGGTELIYRYTVTGSDKASIDTGVDTADAGSNDWTNGDVLEAYFTGRTDEAGAAVNVDVTVNNDTGANYDLNLIVVQDTTLTGVTQLATNQWGMTLHGSGGSPNYPGHFKIEIPDYAGTTLAKSGHRNTGVSDATAGNAYLVPATLGYRSTSAITRLKVAGQSGAKLKVGSQLLIYKRLAS